MSNPTAAMALMFSERLQKMRDATGTAYVEGEGRGDGSVRFRDTFFASEAPFLIVSPVEATSASSACPVQDGTSSGRGSDRELTWVTWRARRGVVPAMAAGDSPSLSPPSAAPPEEKHAPRARARCRVIAGTCEDEQTRREGGLACRAADATAGVCAHAAFVRPAHADDARNGVRVVPLRSENDALARGRSAHRAPDIFLLFSRVARKLRWNEWLDAPDVTDRASEA
jgi:hypothetical protein